MATERIGLVLAAETSGDDQLKRLESRLEAIFSKSQKAATGINAAGGQGLQQFSQQFQSFVAAPIERGTEILGNFVGGFGRIGGIATAGVAGIAAIGAAGLAAARSLGDLGDQIEDLGVLLGTSTQSAGEFRAGVLLAGGNLEQFTTAATKLSRVLGDTDAASLKTQRTLIDMGVAFRDTRGEILPIDQVLSRFGERLGAIENPARRNAIAIEVMGRGAGAIVPDLLDLAKATDEVRARGLAPNSDDISRWAQLKKEVAEVDLVWEGLKNKAKEPIIFVAQLLKKGFDAAFSPGAAPRDPNAGILSIEDVTAGRNRGAAAGFQSIIDARLGTGNSAAIIDQFISRSAASKQGTENRLKETREEIAKLATEIQTLDRASTPADVVAKKVAAYNDLERAAAGFEARLKAIGEAERQAEERRKLPAELAKRRSDASIRILESGTTGGSEAAAAQAIFELRVKAAQAEQDIVKRTILLEEATLEKRDRLNRAAQQDRQLGVDATRRLLESRIALTQAGVTPGGEEAAVQRIYQLRVEGAKSETDLRQRALALLDAGFQREVALAALSGQRVKDEQTIAQARAQAGIRLIQAQSDQGNEAANAQRLLEARAAALRLEQDPAARRSGLIAATSDFAEAQIKAQREAEAFRRDGQQRELEHRIRMIELTAGPGGELAAAQKVRDLRLQAALGEQDARKRTLALQDAEYANQQRIAEIALKQRQEFRGAVGSVFDAALAGGGGIRDLLRSTGLGSLRTITQNGAEALFSGTRGALALPGQTNADGSLTGLGKLLRGSIFAADPMKLATDANTAATQANTAALLARAGVGGGAVGGTLAASGITLPSGVFQGGTGIVQSFGSLFTRRSVQDLSGSAALAAQAANSGAVNSEVSKYLGISGTQTVNAAQNASGLTKSVGFAAAAAGAAFGVAQGVKQGGVQGGLTAAGSAAGGLASILMLAGVAGPAAPIIAGIGLALGLGSSLMPDRRKQRGEAIQGNIDSARFDGGTVTGYDTDLAGNSIDSGKGGMRVVVNQYIQTYDASDYYRQRRMIADAALSAMREGHAINDEIREVAA